MTDGGESGGPGYLRGITLRSVSLSLLGILLMSLIMMFTGGVTRTGGAIGAETLSTTAVWMIIALTAASGFSFAAFRLRILSKAEMYCVLTATLIAGPLIGHGFWRMMFSSLSGIAISANFEFIDAFPKKLWPHGPNLTAGTLRNSNPDNVRVTAGRVTWESTEVEAGEWAEIPVLSNETGGAVSALRFEIPASPGSGRDPILPDQPHLLGVLVRPENLSGEAYYYCRLYYDDDETVGQEVFTERLLAKKTLLHKTGFRRVGAYGVKIPFRAREKVIVELGLTGAGKVAFDDFQLYNVSAIEEAYEGRKILAESDFERLSESDRRGHKMRPASLMSVKGVWFLLTAYLPFREWMNPLIGWGGFVSLVLAGTFAMVNIMRRQWVDNERFLIPLAQVPRALLGTRDKSDGAVPEIWKHPLMWAGFATAFGWSLLRVWSQVNPALPDFNIEINLYSYITDARFGNMFQQIPLSVSALVLGLALLMDFQVLLSLFLGFWLFRSQAWFGEATGLDITSGTKLARSQVMASFITYAGLIMIFTRKYLFGVIKEAIAGTNKSGEVISYRSALILLAACLAGSAIWGGWVGISPGAALLIFLIILSFGFVATKLRAECGAPATGAFPIRFYIMPAALGGIGVLGPEGGIFVLAFAYSVASIAFFVLPGLQLEMLQVGREMRVAPRHILGSLLMGVIGGLLIGGSIYLITCYSRGINGFGNLGSYDPEVEVFGQFTAMHSAATERYFDSGSRVSWDLFSTSTGMTMIYSSAGTVVTAILRQIFAGFWFHPIGFILGPSEMMEVVWGSVLVACVIRFLVLKLGGAAAVREKLFPAAIGLFFGSAIAIGFVVLWNLWLFLYHPGVPSLQAVY
jgi:hypothetical protein